MTTRSLGSCFAVVLALACQSAPTPGASCTRPSDCASPLSCTFGRCRASCVENRDCPSGASCLPSPTGNVCTVDTDLGCESGVGRVCPSGLVCVADRCVATCTMPMDCPSDGECRPGPTPGISFCYDARITTVDAGPLADSGLDAAAQIDDAGSDAASTTDGGTSACTSVCVQGGDEGTVHERACALCGGTVYCWGSDGDDGLGDGLPRMPEGVPRTVLDGTGSPLSQVRSLACGSRHACAVRIDGRVWCWGGDPDGHGSLGDPGGSDHARLSTAPNAVTGITDVFAGTFHTCVAHGPSHQIACFGENAQGQIDPTQPYVVADPAGSTAHPFANASAPFATGAADRFGAGLHRTCIVTTVGTDTSLLCVGLSEDANGGGLGELHTALGADAIDVGGPVTAIAFGVTHECFSRGGRLYCVGGNDFSALGTSTTDTCGAAMSPCTLTPLTVDSGATDWAVIGSGPVSFHTCAAGATGVSCWGRNDHHQAGASTGDVTAPMPISALAAAHVTAISTGVTSTCVVADGGVYCWGLNDHGQLGTAPGAASPTPVHVPVP